MPHKTVLLYFGSFNPIHQGHLIIAEHAVDYSGISELWFVVTPRNPLKKKSSLAPDYDRLHLVHLAIEDNPRFRACDIEFYLPKPSYTIDTLAHLEEKFPNHHFSLLMGSDNVHTLPKWKNYEVLLSRYPIYIYPRPGFALQHLPPIGDYHILPEAPMLHISASLIRKKLSLGLSIRYLVHPAVYDYISSSRLYKSR